MLYFGIKIEKIRFAVLTVGALLLFVQISLAQKRRLQGPMNYEHFSKKNFYFGITLGYNQSYHYIRYNKSFILNDSVQQLQSIEGPGFNLGIVGNLKFGKNLDLRFLLPTLSFAERRLNYQMLNNPNILQKKLESVLLEFPVHFRYKSMPYKDFRFFVVAGAKYSIDLASNSKTRQADDLIKILPQDLALEIGFGFQVFFPYFILSPEIKLSYGVMNIHARNPSLIYSSPIEKLFSRGIAISFHFEG